MNQSIYLSNLYIVSYRILSCLVVSYCILPYRILFYRILSDLIWSYRIYLTLPYHSFSSLSLSFWLSYLIPSILSILSKLAMPPMLSMSSMLSLSCMLSLLSMLSIPTMLSILSRLSILSMPSMLSMWTILSNYNYVIYVIYVISLSVYLSLPPSLPPSLHSPRGHYGEWLVTGIIPTWHCCRLVNYHILAICVCRYLYTYCVHYVWFALFKFLFAIFKKRSIRIYTFLSFSDVPRPFLQENDDDDSSLGCQLGCNQRMEKRCPTGFPSFQRNSWCAMVKTVGIPWSMPGDDHQYKRDSYTLW